MAYQCKWCIAYPKDWDGSDPVCLWNEDGTFNTGNWNCGLDRHLATMSSQVYGEDCSMWLAEVQAAAWDKGFLAGGNPYDA